MSGMRLDCPTNGEDWHTPGRCAIFGFVFISWPEKTQDAYRTSRPIRFGWSMCDIRFCISWPTKSQGAYRTSRQIRLVDVRYSVLYFLAIKITILCIPNEDFGKRNSRSGVFLSNDFARVRIQIQYSHPRKVHRKETPDLLFRFPKSSFGMHKYAYRTSRPIRFGWSMCDIRVCISWPTKSQDAYRTSRPILLGWSMRDIRFCISWPEKSQAAYRTQCSEHKLRDFRTPYLTITNEHT